MPNKQIKKKLYIVNKNSAVISALNLLRNLYTPAEFARKTGISESVALELIKTLDISKDLAITTRKLQTLQGVAFWLLTYHRDLCLYTMEDVWAYRRAI